MVEKNFPSVIPPLSLSFHFLLLQREAMDAVHSNGGDLGGFWGASWGRGRWAGTPGKTGFETSHSWLVLFLCFRKP